MRKSTALAVGGISAALSAAMLFFGGISLVLAYIMPMLAGLIMIMLSKTFGGKMALSVYICVCILSFILTADRECSLMYALFFGYYPVLKIFIDKKLRCAAVKWVLKLALFNAATAAVEAILFFVFGIPFLDSGEGAAFIIIFALLMNFMFIVYDFLVTRLSFIYEKVIDERVKKYLNIK